MGNNLLFVKGKKGILMETLLVLYTIIGVSICLIQFFNGQGVISSAVISPVPVLELRDLTFLFEIEEKSQLMNSYCNFDTVEEVKGDFCNEFDSLKYNELLTKNSTPLESLNINKDNFCERIYDFNFEGNNKLRVKRSGLIKSMDLKSEGENSKINFDMKMTYDLTKEYLLSKESCN
jgi:hypothetical protein